MSTINAPEVRDATCARCGVLVTSTNGFDWVDAGEGSTCAGMHGHDSEGMFANKHTNSPFTIGEVFVNDEDCRVNTCVAFRESGSPDDIDRCTHCGARLQATVPVYVDVARIGADGRINAKDLFLAFSDSLAASVKTDDMSLVHVYCNNNCTLTKIVTGIDEHIPGQTNTKSKGGLK